MPRPLPFVAPALIVLAFSTSACSRTDDNPSADAVARTAQDWTTLTDFTAIDATGPDNVVVTIGNGFAVKADGDPRAVADLDIQVRNGTLRIGRKSGDTWRWGGKNTAKGDGRATIHVTMPAIVGAALTGAGDLELDRAEGDRLDLSLTGAGDFRIGAVKVRSLSTDITGAGSVTIAGTADSAKLSITGAGDIDGQSLTVGAADVAILGAGDIGFASDGQVAITIMGPGDVTVKGKAQCTTKGSGPGEAHCAP